MVGLLPVRMSMPSMSSIASIEAIGALPFIDVFSTLAEDESKICVQLSLVM